ncbi:3-hydroxyacyl-[acyl-carrier-protein] dehydratase [Oryzomicrobium terrae]|uniref:3-hydroxyacyl-[acyl-carrier-protein] dehydratase n=1 Tax=Oryzomicrobium terrae TaxID=1735038 RepID=A0A5C1EBG5_9RHOO|nr:hotdog family protein [Oryzomicrobium terrae]QEL65527.1 3-hydroxyacyl-[acyl-carrier-protein] dehydratase [Oryzomicrobium terrae]
MLNRDDIAARIPHQGDMCLLARIASWDGESIHATATSHRDPANPLRAHGRLGAATGIEYAAQAMAMHGALLADAGGHAERPRAGYLTSVRGVELHAARLDDLADDLEIRAERLSGDDNHVLYAFSVTAGASLLLSGRAAVVLDSAALPSS